MYTDSDKIVNGSTPLSVENKLVFTNVDSFGASTPLTETCCWLRYHGPQPEIYF